MSIAVQNYVWSLDLPPNLKYVAIALADHAHDDGREARPSQEYLAKKTGLSSRQIRRILFDLLELGVIVRERPGGRNRATTYAFVLPDTYVLLYLSNRRTSITNRRTSTTALQDADDLLTIKNPHINLTEPKEEISIADPETARAAIKEARRLLLRGVER